MEKTAIQEVKGVQVQYSTLPCGNYNVRMKEPNKAWTPNKRFKVTAEFKAWWEGLSKLETTMQVITAYQTNVKAKGGCRG